MIAFRIKYSIDAGCPGVVVFDAKTDELAKHYALDFHALELPMWVIGDPRRFMLADEAGGYFKPPTEEAIRYTELF